MVWTRPHSNGTQYQSHRRRETYTHNNRLALCSHYAPPRSIHFSTDTHINGPESQVPGRWSVIGRVRSSTTTADGNDYLIYRWIVINSISFSLRILTLDKWRGSGQQIADSVSTDWEYQPSSCHCVTHTHTHVPCAKFWMEQEKCNKFVRNSWTNLNAEFFRDVRNIIYLY